MLKKKFKEEEILIFKCFLMILNPVFKVKMSLNVHDKFESAALKFIQVYGSFLCNCVDVLVFSEHIKSF